MKTGRIEEAAEAFRACVASRNQRSYSPANPEIFRAGPNHCLAKCLWKLGNAEAAKAALDAALRDEPESRPARMDLARVQAAEKNPVEALKTCHALITSKPDDLEAWALGAEIALGNPGLLEFAVEWTGEAVKHAPASEALAGLRAQALMLSGDSAGAIPFWREAARAPNALSARAALVLCQIVSGAPPNENPVAQEPAVSAEFLKWYQRMVESGANAALCALNARTRELSAVLPTAARRLEAAFADAA
jgi:tetratricopeptide (TPR) repeat protein